MTLRASAIRLTMAAIAGLIAFGLATEGGSDLRAALPSFSEQLDKLALTAGLGIAEVQITGHHFTLDADVYDALDLAHVSSMLRFDSRAVRDRIERLPWVRTASITRVFPSRIEIAITERHPLVRWQRGERHFLVDETGRVLAAVQPGAVIDLPLVKGEGAAAAAGALMDLLEQHGGLAPLLDHAERIGERRWTLHLQGGGALLLPATGADRAIARLAATSLLERLRQGEAISIDLRAPTRIAVKTADGKWVHAPARRPLVRG